MNGDMTADRRTVQLSPDRIRHARFARAGRTRRGLDEDEVYGFLARVSEEMAILMGEVGNQRAENERLKGALRDWQQQYRGESLRPEPAVPSTEAIALMARVQQQIDAQMAEAELYCRRREQEALAKYDEILAEAHRQARDEAERVAQTYRAASGPGYSADQEQLQRQRVYLVALLRAFDALGAHMDATRQAFAMEVEKLGDPAPPPPPPPPGPNPRHHRCVQA